MKIDLMLLRFVLAVVSLVSLVGLAVLVLFQGGKLGEVQITLLTLLCTALVGEVKASSAYIFDGVPKADDARAPAATPTPTSNP